MSRYTTAGECTKFTIKDGLVSDYVNACYRCPDGVMWFGMSGGVSRYDGVEFVNFTTEDGLAHNHVWTIHGDADGAIWCGSGMAGGGVSRYVPPPDVRGLNPRTTGRNKGRFVTFTTEDGLADNRVEIIFCDADGAM